MARLLPIILGIVALIYVILVGAFFAYVTKQEQDKLLRQQTIAKCLDAGGHIGPGVTCWHENSTDKKQWPLP
jgi:hypothetical protein